MGALRSSNASPATDAAISAATPQVFQAASAITSRPVLRTELKTHSRSQGLIERKSIISALIPLLSTVAPALTARVFMAEVTSIITSLPDGRLTGGPLSR